MIFFSSPIFFSKKLNLSLDTMKFFSLFRFFCLSLWRISRSTPTKQIHRESKRNECEMDVDSRSLDATTAVGIAIWLGMCLSVYGKRTTVDSRNDWHHNFSKLILSFACEKTTHRKTDRLRQPTMRSNWAMEEFVKRKNGKRMENLLLLLRKVISCDNDWIRRNFTLKRCYACAPSTRASWIQKIST